MNPETGLMVRMLGARTAGTGDETLLFLNGFGTEQAVWRHQLDHLGGRYTVVTFDHVGSGASQIDHYSAARYSSLHDYADDVLALIDELALPCFSIVAHSVGGMVGALVAIAEPDRCRSLTMIGASPRYVDDKDYTGGFTQSDIDEALAAMRADYHSWTVGFSKLVAANPDQPGIADAYAASLRSLRPDIAHASLQTIFASDMRAILPKITQPTLIVQADQDIAVPVDVGRFMRSRIPRAELHEIPFKGHLPHMLAPAAMTMLIDDFLERSKTDVLNLA